MKITLLRDIHSDLPALETVFKNFETTEPDKEGRRHNRSWQDWGFRPNLKVVLYLKNL